MTDRMMSLLGSSFLLTPELASDDTDFLGIFPRGYVSLVAGEPGIGKTWLMLDYCKGIAKGGFLLGDIERKHEPGRALVFAGETGIHLLASRVVLMGGITPVENVRVVSANEASRLDIDTMINTALGRKNISKAIEDFSPDVVFFDTMISFMSDGKDESSQSDMSDTLRQLNMIAENYKCAIVIMHHFRKKGTKSDSSLRGMDDVIGTSAFTRLTGVVMAIEKKNNVRVCRCLKSWWPEFEPFGFIIKKEGESVRIIHTYDVPLEGASSASQRLGGRILGTFTQKEFSVIDVVAEFDCSRSTAATAVSVLVASGKVRCVGNGEGGKKYVIIPQSEK